MNYNPSPESTKARAAAKAAGLKHYRGLDCKRGHGALRYVSTRTCVACGYDQCRKWGGATTPANPNRTQRQPPGACPWPNSHPLAKMFRKARSRALRKGVPFTITYADLTLPDKCPVLGIPLKVGTGKVSDNSPTLDRVRPARGYVPGNVAVISMRANRLKNDASIEELCALAAWAKEFS